MTPRITIRIQAEAFDIAKETEALHAPEEDVGAVSTFIGYCRSEGGRLSALELEHYPGMADEEIKRVVDDALKRWPLSAICVIHRFGIMKPGDGKIGRAHV